MPKMGNIGVANASAFGFASATIGKGYFIAIAGNTGGSVITPNTVKVDSLGYIYANDGGDSFVLKITPTGSLVYAKKLNVTSIVFTLWSMDLDTSGNIYVAGQYTSTNGGYYKFDNSCATILASSSISLTSSYARCIAVDNSGNIFVSGNYVAGSSPTSRVFIVKYNSSGSITSQLGLKALSTTYGTAIPQNCIINKTTGDLYMVARMTNTNSQNIYVHNKINSSLTSLNSLGLIFLSTTSTAYGGQVGGIDYDSSGNIYMTGTTTTATSTDRYTWVAKYNSTMATQTWIKIYRGTTGFVQNQFTQVRVDRTTDEIYVMGYVRADATNYNKGYIAKYNTSGTVLWNRFFYATTAGNYTVWDITFDGDAYILCGQTAITNVPMVIARLPKDGSKTGTYTVGGASIVYENNTPLTGTRTMSQEIYTTDVISSTATSINSPTVTNWSPGVNASTVIT